MTLTLTIVGRHFAKIGERLMILPVNPTLDEIQDEILRWALRLKDLDWTSIFTSFRIGVCDASVKLDRKEMP